MKKKAVECRCISLVNDKLREFNTELDLVIHGWQQLRGGHAASMMIATRKIDQKKRAKARTVIVTYCPVCGRKVNP